MRAEASQLSDGLAPTRLLTDRAPMERVSKKRPCPICGKPDWCLVAPDGSAAICTRIAEGSKKRCGEAGWLHVLRDDEPRPRVRRRRRTIVVAAPSAQDFAVLAERYRKALTVDGLAALVKNLNVSAKSLRRLGLGWNGAGHTFPMSDGAGQTIGLRIRYSSGFKAAEKGSSNGLFVPRDLPHTGVLLICEGPTDTAAALDLGFAAVGRPSCSTGTRMVAKLARGRDVVIVADNDAPGQKGARSLVSALLLHCKSVRLMGPPGDIKDLRAWKRAGATGRSLLELIEAAPVQRLRICGQRRERAMEHGC